MARHGLMSLTALEERIVDVTAERWREHGLAGNWMTAEDNSVWHLGDDEDHYINGVLGVLDRDFSLHFCLHIVRGKDGGSNWVLIHVYNLLTIYDVKVEWLRDHYIPFFEDRAGREVGHWFVDRVDAYEDAGPPEQCEGCLRAVSGCVCDT